jgi:hypothetical protein
VTVFWDDDEKSWDELKNIIPPDRHIVSTGALEALEAGRGDDVVDVPCTITFRRDLMPDQAIVSIGLPAQVWAAALADMVGPNQSAPLRALAEAITEAWARALAEADHSPGG